MVPFGDVGNEIVRTNDPERNGNGDKVHGVQRVEVRLHLLNLVANAARRGDGEPADALRIVPLGEQVENVAPGLFDRILLGLRDDVILIARFAQRARRVHAVAARHLGTRVSRCDLVGIAGDRASLNQSSTFFKASSMNSSPVVIRTGSPGSCDKSASGSALCSNASTRFSVKAGC